MILLLLSENMDFRISTLLLLFESQWLKIPPCQNSILLPKVAPNRYVIHAIQAIFGTSEGALK